MPGLELNKNLQESRTIANYIPLQWISVYKLTPGEGGGVIPIGGCPKGVPIPGFGYSQEPLLKYKKG